MPRRRRKQTERQRRRFGVRYAGWGHPTPPSVAPEPPAGDVYVIEIPRRLTPALEALAARWGLTDADAAATRLLIEAVEQHKEK